MFSSIQQFYNMYVVILFSYDEKSMHTDKSGIYAIITCWRWTKKQRKKQRKKMYVTQFLTKVLPTQAHFS